MLIFWLTLSVAIEARKCLLDGGIIPLACWGVENRLHWVLDVGFREDDCPIHSDHAPENLAQLRKMSLNLLSQEKTAKIGVANKRLKAAWDNNYLAKVLGI
jgi:hypothetical protein